MGGRLADVIEALALVDAVDEHVSRGELTAELALVARGLAWFEGRQARLAGLLAAVSPVPEEAIAAGSNTSRSDARRVEQRARTAQEVPAFAQALSDGEVRGGHLDALGRGLRRLEPDQRVRLLDQTDALLAAARVSAPDDFEEVVKEKVRAIEAVNGIDRLAQQRRSARARSWTDQATGMWHLKAELDPETGLRLAGRLQAELERRFAGKEPDGCPSDPLEKQGYLRAHALVALLHGQGTGGGADLVVALHATLPPPSCSCGTDSAREGATTGTTAPTSTTRGDRAPATGAPSPPWVDWGFPVELPYDVLVRLYPHARIWPVVICDGVILYAKGTLDLGRTTRLASQAQRRALRALYPTCAIPGCTVPFDQCDIHHRIRWEDGGPTDLSNLDVVCRATHHPRIHADGWQLDLAPNRSLTVTLPGGTTMTTGPPGGRAV